MAAEKGYFKFIFVNPNLFDQIDIYFFKSKTIFSNWHLFFQIDIYLLKSELIFSIQN